MEADEITEAAARAEYLAEMLKYGQRSPMDRIDAARTELTAIGEHLDNAERQVLGLRTFPVAPAEP